jgi:hypothetical protein
MFFYSIDGVDCYDGATNERFSLKVTVLSWSGDTPGLSKLAIINSFKVGNIF